MRGLRKGRKRDETKGNRRERRVRRRGNSMIGQGHDRRTGKERKDREENRF